MSRAGVAKKLTGALADWFEGSKVVDAAGEPLRMYHGTDATFDAFEDVNQRMGHYFSDDPEYASSFGGGVEGSNVIPAYLQIKNPANMLDDIDDELAQKLLDAGYDPDRIRREDPRDYWNLFDGSEKLKNALELAGYDGVRLREPDHGGKSRSSYVAFRPNQIKSIFHDGEDIDSDKFSRGGVVHAAVDAAKRLNREAEDIGRQFGKFKSRVHPSEWRYESSPAGDLAPINDLVPHEAFRPGDVLIPLIGDGSSAGERLHSVNDVPIDFTTEGGFDYPRGEAGRAGQAWASGRGVVAALKSRTNKALDASRAEGFEDPRAFGVSVAMDPRAVDFSHHVADPLVSLVRQAKVTKKSKAEFDATVRGELPDWPGIDHPKIAEYLARDGERRKVFVRTMDSAYFADKGFPDIHSLRFAVSDRNQLGAQAEDAGHMVSELDPNNLRIDNPGVGHKSYNTAMGGKYRGRLGGNLKRDDVFTDFSNRFDASSQAPERSRIMAKRRAFAMNSEGFQILRDREIDGLARKVSRGNNFAVGGAVEEEPAPDGDDAALPAGDEASEQLNGTPPAEIVQDQDGTFAIIGEDGQTWAAGLDSEEQAQAIMQEMLTGTQGFAGGGRVALGRLLFEKLMSMTSGSAQDIVKKHHYTGRDAVVNIGKNVGDSLGLTDDEILDQISRNGGDVLGYELGESTTEPTLIARLRRGLDAESADNLSRSLRQEAIAQQDEFGDGELFGPMADEWGPFNPDYFIEPKEYRARSANDNIDGESRRSARSDYAIGGLVSRVARSMPGLSKARQMAGKVKWDDPRFMEHMDDMWYDTGFYKGLEGSSKGDMLRHEIDDSGARLKDWPTNHAAATMSLSDALDHQELFENYPSLRDLKLLKSRQGLAGYHVGKNMIEMPSLDDLSRAEPSYFPAGLPHEDRALDSLMHEIQHSIQDVEGFDMGTSPMNAGWRMMQTLEGAKSPSVRKALKKARPGDGAYNSQEAYRRNTGEAEARSVETRLKLPRQLRQVSSPLNDYDYPIDALISPSRSAEENVKPTLKILR